MLKFLQIMLLIRIVPEISCDLPLALTKELDRKDFFKDLSSLAGDVIYKIKSQYCYAVITDDIYGDSITTKLFEDIQGHPLFVVKINESEDLLNPSTKTYCMLAEIRKAKCDVNLIFLANGIQVERLLRYGDKTRVLNTRAKFVMLHDYRLFSSAMHYVWKRIINVVFIRLYEHSHRQGVINKAAGRLFELSTVPFPFPIKEVFVLKRLDFWQAGRYRYSVTLFQDRTSNMMGKTFKSVTFVHTPGVIGTNSSQNNQSLEDAELSKVYSGLEVNILNALGKVMNFTPMYYETENAKSEKWGERENNVTLTGLLGEMDAARADFALADLYHTLYHLEVIDLSIPYMVECLTFLTPEATTDNSWLTLILPFSAWMWAGVFISLFLVGFIFYSVSQVYNYIQSTERSDTNLKYVMTSFLKRAIKKTDKVGTVKIQKSIDKSITQKAAKESEQGNIKKLKPNTRPVVKDMFDEFSNCIIYTYSMLLYVSLPKFPLNWSLRLLTGWYWIYCILIVVAYRASMTAILSKPIPR